MSEINVSIVRQTIAVSIRNGVSSGGVTRTTLTLPSDAQDVTISGLVAPFGGQLIVSTPLRSLLTGAYKLWINGDTTQGDVGRRSLDFGSPGSVGANLPLVFAPKVNQSLQAVIDITPSPGGFIWTSFVFQSGITTADEQAWYASFYTNAAALSSLLLQKNSGGDLEAGTTFVFIPYV